MGRAEDIFEKVKSEGESAIDEFILTRKSEELYLDFKRSADDGSGPKVLHQTDRNNLAKAISGFGNSEGGVIVWGIDASRDIDNADVAKAKFPILNVERFVSWLEGAVSGCTVPAHAGVTHRAIAVKSGKGFVLTLIPKSELAPHQCLFDSRYYMRAGSSFLPVPHSVLAGMFGRRPQPAVFQTFVSGPAKVTRLHDGTQQVDLSLGYQIYNKGPVMARDLYSDLRLILPKDKCGARFELTSDDWSGRINLGVWLSLTTKEGFKLAPESLTHPFTLHVSIVPPFMSGKFWAKWTFGCEGSPVNLMEIKHSFAEVERLYREFVTGPPNEEDGHEFIRKLFKLPESR